MKRAVQLILIEYTKPTLLKGGISEYNFSHPELSDSEDVKDNTNNGISNQNPGSNPVATLDHGGAFPNAPETRAQPKRKEKTNHLQPSAKERTYI